MDASQNTTRTPGGNPPAGDLVDHSAVCQQLGIDPAALYNLIQNGTFPRPVQREGNRAFWQRAVVDAWAQAHHYATNSQAAAAPASQPPPQPPPSAYAPPGTPATGDSQTALRMTPSGRQAAVVLDANEQIEEAGLDIVPRPIADTRLHGSNAPSPDPIVPGAVGEAAPAPAAAATATAEGGNRREKLSRAVVSASKRDYKQDRKRWKRRDYISAGELPPARAWPVPFLLLIVIAGGWFAFQEFVLDQPVAADEDINTQTWWEKRLEAVRSELLVKIEANEENIQRLDGEITVVQGQISVVEGELVTTQGEVAANQERVRENQNQINENEGDIESLREENRELVEDIDNNLEQIQENNRKIEDLALENDLIREDQVQIQKDIQDLRRREDELTNEIEAMNEKVGVLEAGQQDNYEKIIEISNRVASLRSELNDQVAINERQQGELDDHGQQIRKLEDRIETILQVLEEHGIEIPDDDTE